MNYLTGKVPTRLFEVFSSLEKSDKVIKDDTQLEKLYSLLETSLNDLKSADLFLSHPEVTSFFQYAASDTQENPFQALILGLRLGPHLYTISTNADPSIRTDTGDAASLSVAVLPWVDSVFKWAIRTERVWEEGSVRNAWVLGLTTMCHEPNGLKWALKQGYVMEAVDSIFDTSIFVSNQAQLLIIAILPELLLASFPVQQINPVCNLSKCVWEKLVTLINGSLVHTGYDIKHVTSSLTMIRSICELAHTHSQVRVSFTAVLCGFAEAAQVWNNRSLAHQVITTLVEVLSLSDESTNTQDWVESFALNLLRNHNVPAMSLASQLLNRGGCIHADRLKDMVMLPMKLLLDDPIYNLDMSIVKTSKETFQEKSHASKVLLNSVNFLLTWTGDDCAAVAPLLARVLEVTLEHDVMMADVNDFTALRQVVSQNSKFQLALLDVLVKISQLDQAVEDRRQPDRHMMRQVFKHCLLLLKRSGIPATLSTKAFTCLGTILHAMEEAEDEWLTPGREQALDTGDGTMEVDQVLLGANPGPLEEFAELLLQGVCDIRWEVRDTTVVTIGSIIHQAKPGRMVVTWLHTHKLAQQVWHSVSDGESYVRASAITALTQLPCHPSLWQQLLDYCSPDEVVSKLMTILAEDTEAFARRSTISLLCRWLQTGAMPGYSDAIQSAVNSSAKDLDWEVKLSVLRYWEDVIQKEFAAIESSVVLPVYATGLTGMKHALGEDPQAALHKHLERLDKDGCLRCLITGAKDYDRSVQYRACQILVTVKNTCATHGLRTSSSSIANKELILTESKKRRLQNFSQEQSEDTKTAPSAVHNGASESGPLTVEVFLEELDELDVDRLLIESSESIDDYVRNPESLFEDILTSLVKEDDENTIDCY